MSGRELLRTMIANNISLDLDGEDIKITAAPGALTTELAVMLRQHKRELVEALRARRQKYHEVIAYAFANPSTREDVGPDWMTDPEGWPGSKSHCEPAPDTCDRCGSDQHRDFPIHGGRSIRRDCGRCGRTLGFLKWQPPREARP